MAILLLAKLNEEGVQTPFFDDLPDAGPRFVVAEGPEGRASYAFVKGKLWAMAVNLTADAVAPKRDPFLKERLEPLKSTLRQICRNRQVVERDEYKNPIAWRGKCSGGDLVVRYDPVDIDAAVQIVVYRR